MPVHSLILEAGLQTAEWQLDLDPTSMVLRNPRGRKVIEAAKALDRIDLCALFLDGKVVLQTQPTEWMTFQAPESAVADLQALAEQGLKDDPTWLARQRREEKEELLTALFMALYYGGLLALPFAWGPLREGKPVTAVEWLLFVPILFIPVLFVFALVSPCWCVIRARRLRRIRRLEQRFADLPTQESRVAVAASPDRTGKYWLQWLWLVVLPWVAPLYAIVCLLLLPVYACYFIFLMIQFWRDARRFERWLQERGQRARWSEVKESVESGSSTLIVEVTPKGPIEVWCIDEPRDEVDPEHMLPTWDDFAAKGWDDFESPDREVVDETIERWSEDRLRRYEQTARAVRPSWGRLNGLNPDARANAVLVVWCWSTGALSGRLRRAWRERPEQNCERS